MQASKILFSAEEISLAENGELDFNKEQDHKKSNFSFCFSCRRYRQVADDHRQQLPVEFFDVSPKISRGEQYLGLPYVMLDYPRIFSKENVFAIRTFFWWGNYFQPHSSSKRDI